MHALSVATGRAVAALLRMPELTEDIANFAELARHRLSLDNAMVIATMIYAQPLTMAWAPKWKFAYCVALSLGVKAVADGFYVSDILEHLTDEFQIEELKEGEATAVIDEVTGGPGAHLQQNIFRTAMINMVLRDVPQLEDLPQQNVDHPFRVLVVDTSAAVCNQYRQLVLANAPAAHVHTCHRVSDATAFVRLCEEASRQLDLVLINFTLDPRAEAEATWQELLTRPNGFDVTRAIIETDQKVVARRDFLYRPFITMVTEHRDAIESAYGYAPDGSVQGCDAVINTLTARTVRALVQGVAV